MPVKIPFVFGLSPQEPPISPTNDLWRTPLPLHRHDFDPPSVRLSRHAVPTYGDYFCAARHFLKQNDIALLCNAVSQISDHPIKADDLSKVAVYLVKHGAYYHPGYVVIDAAGRQWPMVLNVAVSPAGQKIIDGEYKHLAVLNAVLPKKFWPMVYGHGTGQICQQQLLPMFLGQWLEGFHEFHLTEDSKSVIVWDNDHGHALVPPSQVKALLRKASAILAYAYNPLTLEGIGNWHHAAGDFVVKMDNKGLDVRLITVRRYAPVFDIARLDVTTVLEALLTYFIAISLRMRLDRLNGIGKPACYPLEMLPDIWTGLLEGLSLSAADRGLPDDFATTAMQYFALHSEAELLAIIEGITTHATCSAQEQALISQMLKPHAGKLAEMLSQSQGSPT